MKKLLLIIFTTFTLSNIYAQIGVNADNTAPHTSAMLDVKSTTKAFYPPRMTTTEKNAIVGKQVGAMVYDLTMNQLSFYNGSAWTPTSAVWSINGGAFTSASNMNVNFVKDVSSASFIMGSNVMTAPVNLPNGVKISEIKVFYSDNSSKSMNFNLYAQILQNEPTGGAAFANVAFLAAMNVTGTGSNNLNILNTNPIDNSNYAYYMQVSSIDWGIDLKVYGIKITYSY